MYNFMIDVGEYYKRGSSVEPFKMGNSGKMEVRFRNLHSYML